MSGDGMSDLSKRGLPWEAPVGERYVPEKWLKKRDDEIAAFRARVERLEEAMWDMLSGWRYIREVYGDLDGVGWDRCEEAASSALGEANVKGDIDG